MGDHSVPLLTWLLGSENHVAFSPLEYLGSLWAFGAMK